jgi:hypothetical protein
MNLRTLPSTRALQPAQRGNFASNEQTSCIHPPIPAGVCTKLSEPLASEKRGTYKEFNGTKNTPAQASNMRCAAPVSRLDDTAPQTYSTICVVSSPNLIDRVVTTSAAAKVSYISAKPAPDQEQRPTLQQHQKKSSTARHWSASLSTE